MSSSPHKSGRSEVIHRSDGRAGRAAGGYSQPAQETGLALLRAYEPVVCFTKGELFFPTAVGPYVAHCSLWAEGEDAERECIVPAGELTLERLCDEAVGNQRRALSLRLVQAPLSGSEYRRWRRAPRERIVATSRFTTTGVFGRVMEAAFRASLLLRGKVARGLAAAAETTYRERLDADRFTYYGRVVAVGGYLCLQYWFFYAMNDWRSTFNGVNDHEADWEMVSVYLAEQQCGPPRPAWVACSSHDHHGDDLRRRWDDPELRRIGEHPVVFAGAGSHSGAFVPGDYVISVNPPQLRRAIAAVRRMQRSLAPWREQTSTASGIGIPFVDYARGDGVSVGHGQQAHWSPVLIDDSTPWIRGYRGLWGLDTEDHFGGERAPSGPRYQRDGSVRVAWANPLGWAGLQKVAPSDGQQTALLREGIASYERRLRELDEAVYRERNTLRRLAIELRSLRAHDHARKLADTRLAEMLELETRLNKRIATRTELAEELRIHRDTVTAALPSEPPRAHIKAPYIPRSQEQQRRMRFLHLWAAISTPLLLGLIPVVLLARPLAWITTVAACGVLFVGVEAFARRRFISFVASLLLLVSAIALCVGFLALFHRHWRIAVSVVFAVAALALLFGNLGDLSLKRWRR